MQEQLEWAKDRCEQKKCFCESYQWLRAYRVDVLKMKG